jgi:hypothetical protein
MKRIIKSVVLLKGQNGMKTVKSFLIASMVLGTVILATINVVLNEKTPLVSNLTLKNLEAFTEETGEGTSYNIGKCYMSLTVVPNYHTGFRKCASGTTSGVKKDCAGLTNGHTPLNITDCIIKN